MAHDRRGGGPVAAAIGGIAGWIGRAASTPAPSSVEIITAEALSAHKLYVAEVRHPIEVRAAEQHLMPWLSKRVGTNLRIPDLKEYSLKLLGGRLLPGPIGPAALFMYEGPTGERFTIYCSRSKKARTALRYQSGGDVAAMHWVESEIGYVVSGPDDRDRLAKIAQTAYEQMETIRAGSGARGDVAVFRRSRRPQATRQRRSACAMRSLHDRDSLAPGVSAERASPYILARIVGLELAPRRHQLVERLIAAFRQHDAHGRHQVAGAALGGKAFALEPERAARAGVGRDRQFDRAVERRHAHLRAQHRFVERHRKLDAQVVAVALEQSDAARSKR